MTDPDLDALLARYPQLAPLTVDLGQAVALCVATFRAGGQLYICGNGGSAADAEHISGELLKAFGRPRPLPATQAERLRALGPEGADLAQRLQRGLPAIALTNHSAIVTAVDNDQGPDLIFAQQVQALGQAGDLLLGISTSGNSANVCHAARVARSLGVRVLGLTGAAGGRLAPLCDLCLRAPADRTHLVQELHLPMYHYLCLAIERELFPPSPGPA